VDVWNEYGSDPARLRQVAQAIRRFIESDVAVPSLDTDDDDDLASEGKLLTRMHRSYERKPENRRRKIAQFRRTHGGRLFCECCEFDFERTYGEHGEGFIECHHAAQLSSLKPHQVLKLSDLRMLCANCHRMVHRNALWMTCDGLTVFLRRENR
jgi:5-methylcytosine-specific restriction protein A